jgi:hypothetical protein
MPHAVVFATYICSCLKSQKKWEKKDIEVYVEDICELYSAWRETYPGMYSYIIPYL